MCVIQLLLNILLQLLQTTEELESSWRFFEKDYRGQGSGECKSKLKNCSVKNNEETIKENYFADLPLTFYFYILVVTIQ